MLYLWTVAFVTSNYDVLHNLMTKIFVGGGAYHQICCGMESGMSDFIMGDRTCFSDFKRKVLQKILLCTSYCDISVFVL